MGRVDSGDTTLVKGEKPPLPEPIEVLPRFGSVGPSGQLGEAAAAGQRPVVTLSPRPGVATEGAAPSARDIDGEAECSAAQLEISEVWSAAPAGAASFTISWVSLGPKTR